MTTPAARIDWRSRIVRRDDVPARELVANPRNWRTHPENQTAALTAVLDQVGWVQAVIVNDRTGRIVDGHLRARVAAERDARIPVVYVDLTEEEEALILATLDPLAALAGQDDAVLRDLLGAVDALALDPAIAIMLADLADPERPADDPLAHWAGMPAYANADVMPVKRLIVNFATDDAYRTFAALIGQPLTMHTKWIWFPARLEVPAVFINDD